VATSVQGWTYDQVFNRKEPHMRQEQFATQGRRRREPGRWALSLLVTVVAAALASLLMAGILATGAALVGVADTKALDIAGPLIITATFAVVATMTWRGIRTRWHRAKPGGETRWGR
jgi:hypothetical protein